MSTLHHTAPKGPRYTCACCGGTETAYMAEWLGFECRALTSDLSPCGGRLVPDALPLSNPEHGTVLVPVRRGA